MRVKKQARLLILLSVLLLLLNYAASAGAQREIVADTQRENLTIPIEVYFLDGAGSNDKFSTRRNSENIQSLVREVNNIWSQADITIEVVATERVEVPDYLLRGIIYRTVRGGIREFFRGLRRGEVDLKETNGNGLVKAFFARSMGGPNGMAQMWSNTFFVADRTTNNAARVTSHEIGHVLGLRHARSSWRRLLFSGSNGTLLTEREQGIARNNARRLLRSYH